MYEQIKKHKGKNSRMSQKLIIQKKSNKTQRFNFKNNYTKSFTQEELIKKMTTRQQCLQTAPQQRKSNLYKSDNKRHLPKNAADRNTIQCEIREHPSYERWKAEHNFDPLSFAKETQKAKLIKNNDDYILEVKQEQKHISSNVFADFSNSTKPEPDKKGGTVTLYTDRGIDGRSYIADLMHEIDLHAYTHFLGLESDVRDEHKRIYSDEPDDSYRKTRVFMAKHILRTDYKRYPYYLAIIFEEFLTACKAVKTNASNTLLTRYPQYYGSEDWNKRELESYGDTLIKEQEEALMEYICEHDLEQDLDFQETCHSAKQIIDEFKKNLIKICEVFMFGGRRADLSTTEV